MERTSGDYVLKMDNIAKEYSGNRVLKGVNLHIRPGEIHALMGENGAGKSTLMNILFGMPVIHSTGGFEGTIEVGGESVNIDTPLKAMELGIGMVHQEFMLIPGFSVTENIKVGREKSVPNLASRVFGPSMESLDFKAMRKDARKALKTIGLQIEEYVKVAFRLGTCSLLRLPGSLTRRASRSWCLTSPRRFSRSRRQNGFWRPCGSSPPRASRLSLSPTVWTR